MRPARHLVAASALAAVALSGCGSHLNAASSSQQSQLAVAAAVQKSQTTSLRYDLTTRLVVDTSKLTGLSAATLGKLAGLQTVDVTAGAEQESANRQRLTVTIKLATQTHTATVVNYDGQVFYSVDGGGFATGHAPRQLGAGLGAALSQPAKYLDNLPGFQDKGTAAQDGVSVERYSATIDQGLVGKLLAGALASRSAQSKAAGGAQVATLLQGLLQQLVHIDSGTADVYVRSDDGRLDRATLATAVTIDLAKAGSILGGLQALSPAGKATSPAAATSLPGGQVHLDLSVTTHLYDYGAPITVVKPTVDPNAPTLPAPGAGLFG
jgi:hypothetical protein